MEKECKITRLFDFLMKNREFKQSHYYNYYKNFNNAFEAQKAYMKDKGWEVIEDIVKGVIADTKIQYKITERKYTKHDKHVRIVLINTDDNIYNTNKWADLQSAYYKLSDVLFQYGLIIVSTVQIGG